MQQKHAVRSQILKQEGVQNLAVDQRRGRARRRVMMMRHVTEAIVHFQVALDKRQTRGSGEREQPVKHRVDRHACDQTQPEPNENEDLLVEQVDGQRALNGVAMVVLAERAYDEVAHGDARKTRRLPEVLALEQVVDHLEAVDVEVGSEERVEQEELAAHVTHVEQLGEHVQGAYVVA